MRSHLLSDDPSFSSYCSASLLSPSGNSTKCVELSSSLLAGAFIAACQSPIPPAIQIKNKNIDQKRQPREHLKRAGFTAFMSKKFSAIGFQGKFRCLSGLRIHKPGKKPGRQRKHETNKKGWK